MIDGFIIEFDKALRTVFATARSSRSHPGDDISPYPLNDKQSRHSQALMRINHSGEVCAQALYNGQALTSKNPLTTANLKQAAMEETEHLAWCEKRINELGGRKSLLNTFWYAGSFSLGAFAGILGDKWSLGFLAETEQQVGAHIDRHLSQIPEADLKSRAILTQMHSDELSHATMALEQGGAPLPTFVKKSMRLASKIMTYTTYYL